jgi:hypothetical protein
MSNDSKSPSGHPAANRETIVETETPLPPYMERPRLHPSYDLYSERFPSIKRCLIWRVAVDWGLESCIPRAERAGQFEYSRFETCCEYYGKLLGDHYDSQQVDIVKRHLDQIVFIPGEHLGIGVSKLCSKSIFIHKIGSLMLYTDTDRTQTC